MNLTEEWKITSNATIAYHQKLNLMLLTTTKPKELIPKSCVSNVKSQILIERYNVLISVVSRLIGRLSFIRFQLSIKKLKDSHALNAKSF